MGPIDELKLVGMVGKEEGEFFKEVGQLERIRFDKLNDVFFVVFKQDDLVLREYVFHHDLVFEGIFTFLLSFLRIHIADSLVILVHVL